MLSHVSLASIRRYWAVVVIAGLLGGVVAYALSALATPLFRSTAALYFTLSFGRSASELAQGSTYTSNQMLSFGELAASPVVLDKVIDQLGLDMDAKDLAQNVTVATPRDTVVMQISVRDASAQRAADIANAVADQASDVIEAYAPAMENGDPSVSVRVIARATPPLFQYSPDKRLNTGAGGLIGGLLGIIATFFLAAADTRVRNSDSLVGLAAAPYLGSLSRQKPAKERGLVVLREPAGRVAEEYRRVALRLQSATLGRKPLVLVVCSPVPSEDTGTVAANLSAVLADSGQRILLVDAALHVPPTADRTGAPAPIGLRELLAGRTTFARAIRTLGASAAAYLPVGTHTAQDPEELVASPRMAGMVKRARREYDLVLVVSAPVLDFTETIALTQLADGVLLVVRSGATTKADLEQSVDTIRGVGAPVMGVVISGAAPRWVRRTSAPVPAGVAEAEPDVPAEPDAAVSPDQAELPSAPEDAADTGSPAELQDQPR